ncbi:hypothetical protein [Arcanobacterium phocae]|uniref:hypothetical protein n=1 Tax=Arcanobacterium phocae TaxID=131112 RepID=UPI001C0F2565|nr:hypothetical protein [Arcanobacterium phocae]
MTIYIQKLEDEVKAQNELANKVEELREHAHALNNKIAACEIRDLIEQYETLVEIERDKESEYQKTLSEIEDNRNKPTELNKRDKSDTEATRRINTLLSIVFGNEGMRLEATKTGHVVKNRSHNVTPSFCRQANAIFFPVLFFSKHCKRQAFFH